MVAAERCESAAARCRIRKLAVASTVRCIRLFGDRDAPRAFALLRRGRLKRAPPSLPIRRPPSNAALSEAFTLTLQRCTDNARAPISAMRCNDSVNASLSTTFFTGFRFANLVHSRSFALVIVVAMCGRSRLTADTSSVLPNAAVERRRAAPSSAQQAHNEMARLLRARDGVSPSAPTACYASLASARLSRV